VSRPILEALAEMPEHRRTEATAVLHEYEDRAAAESMLNAGCDRLFDWIGKQEFKLALITRNSRKSAASVLDRHGLSFDLLVTRECADGKYKPDPTPLLLACQRLGVTPDHTTPIPVEDMVPAPGQGTLAVQARDGSPEAEELAKIDHAASHVSFEAERRLAGMLGGGCRLPLGAYAEWRDEVIRLLAVVISPDGADLAWSQVEAPTPEEAAAEAAGILRAGGAERILEEVQ
jgi:hypothetical protein